MQKKNIIFFLHKHGVPKTGEMGGWSPTWEKFPHFPVFYLICCDLDLSPTIPTIMKTLTIISNKTCSAGTLNKEAFERYDRKSWEIHTVKVAIGGRKKLQSGGGKKLSASAVTSEWKNLWLGMSLPEMLTNPISTPLSISDLHFFVLEGRKEKIPAYRGTGAPTHLLLEMGRGSSTPIGGYFFFPPFQHKKM